MMATNRKMSDREFLEASLFWPNWPMLPLIKRGDANAKDGTGFLFSYSREPEPVVYFGNMFSIREIADKIKAETGNEPATWQQILATFDKREFSSLDAVLETYRID